MKRPRNNPTVPLDRVCSKATYTFYYGSKSILPKTAAGLLNGYDEKNEKVIFANHRVQADYEKIKTAVNHNLIKKIDKNQTFTVKCELNTIDFFKWAIKNYTGLEQILIDYNIIEANNSSSTSTTQATVITKISTPTTDIIALYNHEINMLTYEIHTLKEKLAVQDKKLKILRPLAKKYYEYKKSQSKKAQKPRNNN